MKRYLVYIISGLVIMTSAASCEHKDLCYDHNPHAMRYHVNVLADYRLEWEELGDFDWVHQWPEEYTPYDSYRPSKPTGLRVVNYNDFGDSNIHNISADGGVVSLYEGNNDVLFYNNDTEYIVFTNPGKGATTRATTRTRTRATYMGNTYGNEYVEETVTPPDMLFANYIEDYVPEKLETPADLKVTLHPLVFTYKIRYEFESGLEYVSLARGALSGMAREVLMNTGATSEEPATILYDCDLTDFGARALVKSFGIPDYPNANYQTRGDNRHALNLEIMLTNGHIVTFEFDVTDQVKAQPHGGVIVVDGIVITEDQGMQGSGAFDVEVNDWGEWEDITLPL